MTSSKRLERGILNTSIMIFLTNQSKLFRDWYVSTLWKEWRHLKWMNLFGNGLLMKRNLKLGSLLQ